MRGISIKQQLLDNPEFVRAAKDTSNTHHDLATLFDCSMGTVQRARWQVTGAKRAWHHRTSGEGSKEELQPGKLLSEIETVQRAVTLRVGQLQQTIRRMAEELSELAQAVQGLDDLKEAAAALSLENDTMKQLKALVGRLK